MGPVLEAFPIPIDGPVYHAGYHAEASFGATSYLIRRPEGNVLVRVRAGDARGRARVSISIFTRICTRGVKLVSKRSFRVKRP